MDKIKVDSGIKKIEVNDKGEYISIPINDATFYERFGNILEYFDCKQTDIERQAKELADKYQGKEDNDTNMIIDSIKMYSDLCKEVCGELDKLFGEGCCKKVFVDIESPSVELIGDFFEQITPLLHQYANERNEKFNLKYNRKRKGARS